MNYDKSTLTLKYLGIDTYTEPVIYMREDCQICQAGGFQAPSRVKVTLEGRSIIATLNTIHHSDTLHRYEASLSTYAWNFLHAKPGDKIRISYPEPSDSLSYIHSKVYGNELSTKEINCIVSDIIEGQLSDLDLTMFITATAQKSLNKRETFDITRAMVKTGQQLSWPAELVVDKHCVGGLPGNRTTLIVVPIVAAFGLMIPKTSSRAITSPAGTADTMEVFAPVNLDLTTLRKVVEKENGCIAWGGTISLSPADDLLIRIEKAIDLDSESQLVASILSKKIAAGSNRVVIDMPIGPTAKIRSIMQAEMVKKLLAEIGADFGVKTNVVMTDGTQPVGRGIGPALEAKDVVAVLTNDKNAPQDLRERALILAGHILEFSPKVKPGTGISLAKSILNSGQAWKKFQAICQAQGGMREIPTAKYTQTIEAKKSGKIVGINNRYISRAGKLAGAPDDRAAGLELMAKIGDIIQKNQPLFVIHSNSQGELDYALSFLQHRTIFEIE